MVKRILFFCFVFLIACSSFAATGKKPVNMDSLTRVMDGPEGNKLDHDKRMRNFLVLSDYFNRRNTQRSYQYAVMAGNEAKAIPNRLGEAMALNMMAGALSNQSKYDSAEILYEKSLEILQQLNDTTGIIQITNNMGAMMKSRGNYRQAIQYYKSALAMAEKRHDKGGIVLTANNLGIIYFDWKQYDVALEHYQKSLAILTEAGDSSRIAVLLNNIGELYKEIGQPDKALANYNKALALSLRLGLNMTMMNSYFNIGDVYLMQSNYKDAIGYFEKGLDAANKVQFPFGIAYAKIHLGAALLKAGNMGEAGRYLNEGLASAKSQNDLSLLKEVHENLYEYYRKTGNLSLALENHVALMAVSDSLFNKNSRKELSLLRTEYETDKKEKEIKLLTQDKSIQQLEISRQKSLVLYTSVVSLLILLALYFAYTRYRLKQKQIKDKLEQKSAEFEQRLLRSQMNPHFIFNSLNSINGFIGSREPEAAKQYLTKFAMLIRLILENSRKTMVCMTDEINTIQIFLELERLRLEGSFEFTIACNEEIDPSNTYIPPMLIQPFVENAILHGVSKMAEGGQITIDLAVKDGNMLATVTDNGLGRKLVGDDKQEGKQHNSLGTQLTKERLALLSDQYHKKFDFEILDQDSSGVKVNIWMPFEVE